MPQWIDTPQGPVYVDEAALGLPGAGTSFVGPDGAPAGGAGGAPPLTPEQASVRDYAAALASDDPAAVAQTPDQPAAPAPSPLVDPFVPAAPGPDLGAAARGVGAGVGDLASEAAALAPGTSASSGGSVSVKGTTDKQRRDARSMYERDLAAIDAGTEAEKRSSAEALYATSSREAEALAGQFDVEAARAAAAADMAAFNARLEAERVAFEAAAVKASLATAAKAKADFDAQVQAFRGMKVDPGQWWGNLTPGQRAGTLGAVFIANFLGAKGINTTVMSSLNDAIDRNIDAQVRNINNAGEAATMFKQAWDMVRSQSATEAEARERIRAMSRVVVAKEIEAELMRFDAPLAQAKAAAVRAEMERSVTEQLVTKVFPEIDKRAEDARRTATTAYGQDLDARSRNYSTAANERIAKAQIAAAKEKGAGKPPPADPRVVRDPVNGKVIGYATGPDEQVKDTVVKLEGYTETQRIAAEVKAMQQKYGKVYNGPGALVFQGSEEAELRSLYNRWVSARVKALSGAAATDKEREFIAAQMPFDSWVVDANRAVNANLISDQEAFNEIKRSRLADPNKFLTPEQISLYEGVALGSERAQAEADVAGMENRGEIRKAAPDPRLKRLTAPDADKNVRAPNVDPDEVVVYHSAGVVPARAMTGADRGTPMLPQWAVAMDEYADSADSLLDDPERLAEAEEYIRTLGTVATGADYATVAQLEADLASTSGWTSEPADQTKSAAALRLLRERLLPKYRAATGTSPARDPYSETVD